MTYQEMQTYCLDRYAITAGDTAKVTQIQNLLNGENYRIHALAELLIAVTNLSFAANTGLATVPTDWVRPRYLQDGKISVMPAIPQDQAFAQALATASGAVTTPPNQTFTYDWRPPATMLAYPIANATHVVAAEYVQRPPAMSAAGDAPGALPAEFHDMLCEIVCVRIGISEGEFSASQLADQLSDKLVADLKRFRKVSTGPSTTRVRMKVYG